jgi:hypothetical protein
MPRYAITEKAGTFVAAHRNTGVGMVLELTGKQAEHEVRARHTGRARCSDLGGCSTAGTRTRHRDRRTASAV